ncbi:hypothetical protein HUO09_17070 [Vibrio sp. Y2-5]|uniref:YajG family lipoprotein n=1 Tax=Vibrio sp. Y2-5 TaxID=2743977 RepID=UPI0016600D75|nr:YajG family lipoprotein [Vibrio sp. Y2-5]MBD0788068.1 hypothetical protein [Vibrio sp. Y2-5]
MNKTLLCLAVSAVLFGCSSTEQHESSNGADVEYISINVTAPHFTAFKYIDAPISLTVKDERKNIEVGHLEDLTSEVLSPVRTIESLQAILQPILVETLSGQGHKVALSNNGNFEAGKNTMRVNIKSLYARGTANDDLSAVGELEVVMGVVNADGDIQQFAKTINTKINYTDSQSVLTEDNVRVAIEQMLSSMINTMAKDAEIQNFMRVNFEQFES